MKLCLSCSIATLLLLVPLGCEPATRGDEPVEGAILILVDALRADHLGCYDYARETSPALDALAADGTLFLNAVSPAPWTLPTMGTIWTSLSPSVHGASRPSSLKGWMTDRKDFRPVTSLHESRTTLAEVLDVAGFSTVAYVDGSYPGATFGFAQGFDEFFEDDLYGVRMHTEALLDWLERKRGERFFAYVHVVEVHSPYLAPMVPRELAERDDEISRRQVELLREEGQRYQDLVPPSDYRGPANGSIAYLRELANKGRNADLHDVEHVVELYDRGIRYVDFWLGELIAGLKERGLYDRTVLVVTADHGDEFLEHGGLEHGRTYYEEMVRVPLVVRVPGRKNGRTIEQQVGLIDLMPTILDLLDVPHELELQGGSLKPLIEGGSIPERPMFMEASQSLLLDVGVRTNETKYIRYAQARAHELYDLSADPGETNNLCRHDPGPCRPWSERVDAWRAEMDAAVKRLAPLEPSAATIDDRTREQLRRLGYDE